MDGWVFNVEGRRASIGGITFSGVICFSNDGAP